MNICRSFPPVIAADSKVLILGSMPGKKSLAMQQYYAHPQNRFWKLMAALFEEKQPVEYSDKLALLRKNRVALWDVLGYCEREGSLDSDIRNEQPNDIPDLLQNYPQLEAVFCNGGKAGRALKKYFAASLKIPVYYLHSTSPANAKMNLAALREEWQQLKIWTEK